ncbi:MAG: site-specific integrase [Geobacteraceae bacterium]|nr:site-specific integrase [Geobacteraceae bacterium]
MPKIRKTKGIYRRGRVYWITFMGLDGKQKYESTGSDLKADAELLLAQRRLDIDQGKEPVTRRRDRNYTFSHLAEKYLPFVQNQKAYSIKKLYVAALVREFGAVKLNSLTLAMVEGWQSKLLSSPRPPVKEGGTTRPPIKPASVNKYIGALKHMLTKAVDWDLISEDVAKRVRKVKIITENNRRLRYLSIEESAALLNACDKHLKPIITFALNTGCRRGEILGLTWDRIDLKHGFILLDDTKSGKRREIPINANVRAALQGIVRRIDVQYVFVNPETVTERPPVREGGKKRPASGRYYDVKKSFATACRKAGIKDFHFHDLRHTFASQLVMNGVDITTVSKLLGHANLTMTLRYAHLAPDHLQSAVDVLSRLSSSHDILHDTRAIMA